MSREVPMLFSGHLVRAILGLDGKLKTQTRRPIGVSGYKSVREFGRSDTPGYDWHFRRPDLCWCDLTHAELMQRAPVRPGDTLWVRETWAEPEPGRFCYRASFAASNDANWYDRGFKWAPSIHMPRRAARVFLEVTAVRAECIAAISDEDARAEGFKDSAEFTRAWAGIYGSCDGWCWVIEFKRKEVADGPC